MAELRPLPLPTIKRLPLYLEILKCRKASGEEWLSSESISRELGLTAIQVRKDLGLTGAPASPKRGFRVEETTVLIEGLLGAKAQTPVFIIGAGAQGEAACRDPSLSRRGFRIIAAFDPSPESAGQSLCGLKVLPLSEMPALARHLRVRLALFLTRESAFPGCARLAAEAGIRGLVNLSGEPIEETEDLIIFQEDLGFQLAALSRELDKITK
jgi:redox-sensing transcriptional repressor